MGSFPWPWLHFQFKPTKTPRFPFHNFNSTTNQKQQQHRTNYNIPQLHLLHKMSLSSPTSQFPPSFTTTIRRPAPHCNSGVEQSHNLRSWIQSRPPTFLAQPYGFTEGRSHRVGGDLVIWSSQIEGDIKSECKLSALFSDACLRSYMYVWAVLLMPGSRIEHVIWRMLWTLHATGGF